MNDSLISILGAVAALTLLAGIAYALDHKRRSKGQEKDQEGRKIFYASLGLYLGGLILLGIGALYSSTLIVVVSIIIFISGWAVRWIWRIRKARLK